MIVMELLWFVAGFCSVVAVLPPLPLQVHHFTRKYPGYFDPIIERYYQHLEHFDQKLSDLDKNAVDYSDTLNYYRTQITNTVGEMKQRLDLVKSKAKDGVLLRHHVLRNRPIVDENVVVLRLPVEYYTTAITSRCYHSGKEEVFHFLRANPDPDCISVFLVGSGPDKRLECGLPSYCTAVGYYTYKDARICYGHRTTNAFNLRVTAYGAPVDFVFNEFSLYCNYTNNMLLNVPSFYYHNYTDFHPSRAVVSYNFPFITFTDHSYTSVLFKMLHTDRLGVFVDIGPYKYVCDDYWFNQAKIIDDINIFYSHRGCKYHIMINPQEKYCVDYLIDDFEHSLHRCPSDDYDFTYSRTYEHYFTLTVDDKSFDVNWTYIQSGINYFFEKLNDVVLRVFILNWQDACQRLTAVVTRLVESFDSGLSFRTEVYEQFFNYLTKFLGYRSFSLDHVVKNSIDYFFKSLVANSTTNLEWVEHENIFGLDIGKWLADALTSVLKPFWQVFLDILRDAFSIITNLLMDLVPLLESFSNVLQDSLDKLIVAVGNFVNIVFKLLVHLIVMFDKKIYLSEYLLLYVYLAYYWRSTVPPIVLLIILILIFGITRKFPSLFLLLLNHEFKFEMLDSPLVRFIKPYSININYTVINVTHALVILSVPDDMEFQFVVNIFSPFRLLFNLLNAIDLNLFVYSVSKNYNGTLLTYPDLMDKFLSSINLTRLYE